MQVPFEFYDIIRNKLNLSEVVRQKISITRKSGEYVGLCPFHLEKTPSFYVNDLKKFYHCFGCGASGDVIKFISNIHGFSYNESAIKLANDYGIEIPKLSAEQKKIYEESEEISDILTTATEFFKTHLNSQVTDYLISRGINQETIDAFDIGYAPPNQKLEEFFKSRSVPLLKLHKSGLVGRQDDGRMYILFQNRIMFPIRNIYNKIIGFGGRTLGNNMPKYLNSPETIVFHKGDILYAEHKALTSIYRKNYSLLVEGYMDVIALHQAGFTEAVASLGTSVNESHLERLWRNANEIIVCLDGDNAGTKATQRLINIAIKLISSNKEVSFIRMPSDSDPDDLLRTKGATSFKKLLEDRTSLSETIWRLEYTNKAQLKSPEKKAFLEKRLKEYSKQINDSSLKAYYYEFFKSQIWNNSVAKRVNKSDNQDRPPSTEVPIQDIERLEMAFCVALIKHPKIFLHEDRQNFLLSLRFHNELLGDFVHWFCEEILYKNISNIDEIENIVKTTRFFEIFLVLLGTDYQCFCLTQCSKDSVEHLNLIWDLLTKQHHATMLKIESENIVDVYTDHALQKLSSYAAEISKTNKEIAEIEQKMSELQENQNED